jgi:phage FluMu protein Com
MSNPETTLTFSCRCGQVLAVPQSHAGQRVRCPKCSQVVTVPVAKREQAPTVQAAEPDSLLGHLCSVCQSTIATGEAAILCPSCRSPYHQECWQEVGGCATYGCEQMPEQTKAEAESSSQQEAWGDVKECPRCHKEIMAAAVKCRFCKASFPSPVPMSQAEYLAWSRQQKELAPTRSTAISLFVASLFGLAAPLVLAFGGAWVIKYRKNLRLVGGVHEVLAYAGVGLSLAFTLIFLLIALI